MYRGVELGLGRRSR